jgi:hypothetical protein
MDMLEAAVVPARERSIEIFGNKKTLDQLQGTGLYLFWPPIFGLAAGDGSTI